jgi:hypothetical protein
MITGQPTISTIESGQRAVSVGKKITMRETLQAAGSNSRRASQWR